MNDEQNQFVCPICGWRIKPAAEAEAATEGAEAPAADTESVTSEKTDKPEDKKSLPVCPKCGQEMDDRGDGVLVCGDCGWEEKTKDED